MYSFDPEQEQSNDYESLSPIFLFNENNSITIQNPFLYISVFNLNVETKIEKLKVSEEKSTDDTNKNIEIPINQNSKDEDAYIPLPTPCFCNEIKQIFLDNNINPKFITIIDKYKDDLKLKEAEKDIIITHKGRNVNKYKNNENFGKFKRGRKKKDEATERKHGKFSDDNIIKKIKSKLIDFSMKYINNIISNLNSKKGKGEEKINLKKLNYKDYVDSIERKENLNFLQKPIKDILSYEISSKFSKFPKNWNLKHIEAILDCNKDVIIRDIFDMKFNEWIDIFLLKKKAKYHETIEKNLPAVGELLENILSKNGEYYLSIFIFYLYNYERWFYNKVGRNRTKNKKKNNYKNINYINLM